MNQAQLLDKEIHVDHVVALNVPNDEIVNRLKDRWVHAASGRVYNLLWNPPKVAVCKSIEEREKISMMSCLNRRAKTMKQVNR